MITSFKKMSLLSDICGEARKRPLVKFLPYFSASASLVLSASHLLALDSCYMKSSTSSMKASTLFPISSLRSLPLFFKVFRALWISSLASAFNSSLLVPSSSFSAASFASSHKLYSYSSSVSLGKNLQGPYSSGKL